MFGKNKKFAKKTHRVPLVAQKTFNYNCDIHIAINRAIGMKRAFFGKTVNFILKLFVDLLSY